MNKKYMSSFLVFTVIATMLLGAFNTINESHIKGAKDKYIVQTNQTNTININAEDDDPYAG